ncbi:ABC-2 type transport system permease protein [Hathewaya proteolytica DSM 3090]|uniref:Transport permease protein n=1 Tax=Hathewaya proteolytica DSM 3090 TaxID=1121331 RepID=A0A1M6K577_9CLOT|nr:ABC transporter permease [Hathewaya proteolytica]SHJ54114.1 ABC-2 type transport system permease protein [Hathewaya proteolytica DSM 3090]
MRTIFMIIKAEIIKQYNDSFNSYFTYCSLLLWPILGLFTVYFTYKPFSMEKAAAFGINNGKQLMIFLCTGYVAYNCFWAMVQSAWRFSSRERTSGTLEMAFISPANRMALIYGKALGSLLQQTWMFVSFCIVLLIYVGGFSIRSIVSLPLLFVILIISSTVWGGMLNSLFLFSRDSSILMNVLDDPMVLFSGVKMPVTSLPHWGQVIGSIFPLTYCLNISRSLLTNFVDNGFSCNYIMINLGKLLLCLLLMFIITKYCMKKAEEKNRKYGNFEFY